MGFVKFFNTNRSPQSAFNHMEREFYNLNNMRSMGFCRYPLYIASPLGRNANLNCLLVMEFCYGASLHDFVVNAIQKGAKEYLFQKLTALAYFLATLHNRTANGIGVNFGMSGDALINTGDAQS